MHRLHTGNKAAFVPGTGMRPGYPIHLLYIPENKKRIVGCVLYARGHCYHRHPVSSREMGFVHCPWTPRTHYRYPGTDLDRYCGTGRSHPHRDPDHPCCDSSAGTCTQTPAGASRSVVLLVMGVLGLLVGIAAILYRWIAAEALTVIIALLMLFFGFIDLSIAIFHPEYTRHRFLLVFSGAISIILGGVFFFLPGFGAICTRCRISRDICHHLRYPEYSHRCHGKKRTEEGDVRVTGFIVRIPADFSGRSGHQSSTGRCVTG